MIEGGADLLTVSRIAGHRSVGTTGDIYGHVFESGKLRAAENTAALLAKRVMGGSPHTRLTHSAD